MLAGLASIRLSDPFSAPFGPFLYLYGDSMKDKPEIELTIDDITKGSEYVRSIVIESKNPHYDGKTIKYRSLTGEEMADAMTKAKMGRSQDPADSIKLMIEIGKTGVVSPGIGKAFGKLPNDVITSVGSAILGVSQPSEKDVEKIFQEQ